MNTFIQMIHTYEVYIYIYIYRHTRSRANMAHIRQSVPPPPLSSEEGTTYEAVKARVVPCFEPFAVEKASDHFLPTRHARV